MKIPVPTVRSFAPFPLFFENRIDHDTGTDPARERYEDGAMTDCCPERSTFL